MKKNKYKVNNFWWKKERNIKQSNWGGTGRGTMRLVLIFQEYIRGEGNVYLTFGNIQR